MTIDPWLLERLVCPVTRTPLLYDPVGDELIGTAAGLAYPVRDGVPILLADAARRLGDHPDPVRGRSLPGRPG